MQKDERLLEQQHVKDTIALIDNEATLLKKQQANLNSTMSEQLKKFADKKIQVGSENSFYESVLEYQKHEEELLMKYHTSESQEKRLKTLTTMEKSPYFARIDFTEEDEKETLYIGIASLRTKDEETIVIDWRAPIANLYYEGELGPAYYETDFDRFDVELQLKRQFKIQDGEITSMVDTSEIINDEFLLEVLDEASSSQMKNIVATIQKAQNDIIRDTENKFLLIEGIAGSGKTSALLQRIAFLLYRNRKWLADEQVLLFSPNHLFSDYISMVLPSLGESEVPTRTFKTFIGQLVPQYEILQEEEQEAMFLSGEDDRIEKLKSGLALVELVSPYIRAITEFGPLFKDLKIQGETYITKTQIRRWYQETNPQLPLYQRTRLLQTKILTKIGGLEKDEARKTWVKEAAEEALQALFEDNPTMDDSEENERRMRNKIRKQIVRKKFRRLIQQINRFQFINYPKQYLHFLQNVPTKVYEQANITTEQWQNNILQTRQQLREKSLRQEDAILFFLLLKSLYPVDVSQKARFIFIDEMQDFPPAQVALLRQLYPKASITLCGDLNQKVFGNETIVACLPQLFADETVKRYQLTTSYRSTEAITNFANEFMTENNQVKMTARTGDLPIVVEAPNTVAVKDWLVQTLAENEQPQWRTAIICKTTADCEAFYATLSPELQHNMQLIVSEEDFMKRSIMIIPAFLAKGLEFDRVFAWQIDENFSTTQDQLVLYTIATRAMHELVVLTTGQSPLLRQTNPETYKKIKL